MAKVVINLPDRFWGQGTAFGRNGWAYLWSPLVPTPQRPLVDCRVFGSVLRGNKELHKHPNITLKDTLGRWGPHFKVSYLWIRSNRSGQTSSNAWTALPATRVDLSSSSLLMTSIRVSFSSGSRLEEMWEESDEVPLITHGKYSSPLHVVAKMYPPQGSGS